MDISSSLFNDDDLEIDTTFDQLLTSDDAPYTSATLFEGIDDFIYSKLPSSPLCFGEVDSPGSMQSTTSEGDSCSDFLDLESFFSRSFDIDSLEGSSIAQSIPVTDALTVESREIPVSCPALDVTPEGAQHMTAPTPDQVLNDSSNSTIFGLCDPGVRVTQPSLLTSVQDVTNFNDLPVVVEVLSSGSINPGTSQSSTVATISLEDVMAMSGLDVSPVDAAPVNDSNKRVLDSPPDGEPPKKSRRASGLARKPGLEVVRINKMDERRRKNNIASKISRATRKSKHQAMFDKEEQLLKDNAALKVQIEEMTKEAERLRKILIDKLSKADN